jgi:hypothetical protein
LAEENREGQLSERFHQMIIPHDLDSDFLQERSMNEDVIPHLYHPMAEARREREIVDGPEGQALQDAIFKAVYAYSRFLDQNGLIWEFGENDDDLPRMKAHALVVTVDYEIFNTADITLKGGALDRGSGE